MFLHTKAIENLIYDPVKFMLQICFYFSDFEASMIQNVFVKTVLVEIKLCRLS